MDGGLCWNLPCWVVKRAFLREAKCAVGARHPFGTKEQPADIHTADQKPLTPGV